MKFIDLVEIIDKATAAEDVVGPDDDGRKKRERRIKAQIHPDGQAKPDLIEAANRVSKRLSELLRAEKAHRDAKVHAKFDLVTKRRSYRVDGLEHRGVIANLYRVVYERDGEPKHGLLKVARSPKDGDLIQAESKALADMWKVVNPLGEPDGRRPFIPRLEDVLTYRDTKTHIDRRANVQRALNGFVSLDKVFEHFPDGLDVRDLAWIWRRLLAAISLAHDTGYVHGSVTPAHVLVHPEVHGVQIVGWGQSVENGAIVKLLGDRKKFFIAPEVLKKEPASPATDIYSINQMMLWATDHTSPGFRRFASFVRGCTFENPGVRPQNAIALLQEYDELLERSFGPRRFRVFPEFPGRTHEQVVL